jgi:hypothetical protein
VSAISTTLPTSGISTMGERLPPAASTADMVSVIERTLIVDRKLFIGPCAAGPLRFAMNRQPR